MSLKIAVCMKQVPNVARIRFDPETRRVVREGVAGLMDTFENRALGFAARYRAEHGASVTAITMGPPQAREILEQAIATGTDDAIHLSDRAFAGADTLATSRALAAALRPRDFDLILCGRHSTDSETGQVGPELAEHLGIPHITGVRLLEIDERERTVRAERETDDGIDVLACPLPALISVSEEIGEEVWPKPEALKAVDPAAIATLGAADLDGNPSEFGAAGSPTWVGEIYAEQTARLGVVIAEGEPDAMAEELVAALLERSAFAAAAEIAPLPARQRSPRQGPNVWVWAEHAGSRLRPVSFELLGAAAAIADSLDGNTATLLLGGDEAMQCELAAHGADEVLVAPLAGSPRYEMETYTAVLAAAIASEQPYAVLLPASADGRDLAPRVAARLGLGLTGDCIGLQVDAEGRLVQLKPAFGGNIIAPVYSRTTPQMATVRPGLLGVPGRNPAAVVRKRTLPAPAPQTRIRLVGSRPDPATAVSELEEAAIVVGVGKGVGGPEGLPAIRELAGTLGAQVGATRAVTDLGWLPRQRQVGLTGRAIAPALYVAVGVSGSFNHMVGVLKAGTIVAINRSPRAPIAKAADFTLIGDWAELVPALNRALGRAREQGRLAPAL
jgi:electron transfer flavoprotein alpha subunit